MIIIATVNQNVARISVKLGFHIVNDYKWGKP
jgi:hypothetical protein